MVSKLELPGLGRTIVDPALFGLGLEHVLVDEGCDPFDVVLHFLDVSDGGSESGWLFFLCLLHHVQKVQLHLSIHLESYSYSESAT